MAVDLTDAGVGLSKMPVSAPVDEKLWTHNKFLSRFLEMNAEQELTDLYRIWPGIFTISACLERRVWGEWEQKLYPNQFVCLVGDPAAHKSFSMSYAEKLLRQCGVHILPSSMRWERMLKKLAELSEVQSFWCEATGEFVEHASATGIVDELAVFTGYKDSIRLQTLCQLYNCQESFLYSTNLHGDLNVKNVCLNILAGVQPAAMLEVLPREAFGGGFTSRIIFVYSDVPKKEFSSARTPEQIKRQSKAEAACLAMLEDIRKLSGPFTITEAFNERYVYWREVESVKNPPLPYYDEHLQHYMGRREAHFRKLAMAISAGRSCEMVLRESDFIVAKDILERTERVMPMAMRQAGWTPDREMYERIGMRLMRNGRMSYEQILRQYIGYIDDKRLAAILNAAKRIGRIRETVENGVVYYEYVRPMPGETTE